MSGSNYTISSFDKFHYEPSSLFIKPICYPHTKSFISNISTGLYTLSTENAKSIQVVHITKLVDMTGFLTLLHNSTKTVYILWITLSVTILLVDFFSNIKALLNLAVDFSTSVRFPREVREPHTFRSNQLSINNKL